MANDGYWGIPVRPDTTYSASFFAKSGGGFAGPVTASLVLEEGKVTVAKAETRPVTGTWQKYTRNPCHRPRGSDDGEGAVRALGLRSGQR